MTRLDQIATVLNLNLIASESRDFPANFVLPCLAGSSSFNFSNEFRRFAMFAVSFDCVDGTALEDASLSVKERIAKLKSNSSHSCSRNEEKEDIEALETQGLALSVLRSMMSRLGEEKMKFVFLRLGAEELDQGKTSPVLLTNENVPQVATIASKIVENEQNVKFEEIRDIIREYHAVEQKENFTLNETQTSFGSGLSIEIVTRKANETNESSFIKSQFLQTKEKRGRKHSNDKQKIFDPDKSWEQQLRRSSPQRVSPQRVSPKKRTRSRTPKPLTPTLRGRTGRDTSYVYEIIQKNTATSPNSVRTSKSADPFFFPPTQDQKREDAARRRKMSQAYGNFFSKQYKSANAS